MRIAGPALLMLLAWASAPSARANGPVFGVHEANGRIQVPKYLFHWDSEDGLRRLAQAAAAGSGSFPLRPITRQGIGQAAVAYEFPGIVGKPGWFAWSHPTAAMGVNITGDPDMPGEIYARGRKGHPPSLIAAKIRPDARVLVIRSDGTSGKATRFDEVDLVLHIKDDGMGISYREWILLNPAAIEPGAFTASPRGLPPEVLDEMLASTRPGAVLKENERFILRNSDEPTAAAMVDAAQSPEWRGARVREFLQTPESRVPEYFRNRLAPAEPGCVRDSLGRALSRGGK
jgi:hypothetical protein